MKIEKNSRGGKTTICLIGQFQSEHVEELEKQSQDDGLQIVLDLKEVMIVDVEVVRFLGACESGGMKLLHCSPYIREWIVREQQRNE
jgi:hypothetical protein